MPKYGYKCSVCNDNFDAFSSIENRNEKQECPICKTLSQRDVEYEIQTSSNFNETCKEHIRYSNAMGVNPKRIKEMERKFPDSKYTTDGRLIINSRADKLKKMKERNLVEFE